MSEKLMAALSMAAMAGSSDKSMAALSVEPLPDPSDKSMAALFNLLIGPSN